MQGYIFWDQQIRIDGSCTPETAAARLAALLAAGRGAFTDRLVGAVRDFSFRVWRRNPVAVVTDIVQCEGVIRANGAGCVVEGRLHYKLATKIQFVGCLLLGLFLLMVGGWQGAATGDQGGQLAGVGLLVTAIAAIWVYSSHRLKHEQIRFIESQLEKIVAD